MGGKYTTVEATGGADSVTLSETQMPSHSHSFSATAQSAGAHTHQYKYYTGAATGAYDFVRPYSLTTNITGTGNGQSNGAHTHPVSGDTASKGGSTSHENRQQYITCYMWKRVT